MNQCSYFVAFPVDGLFAASGGINVIKKWPLGTPDEEIFHDIMTNIEEFMVDEFEHFQNDGEFLEFTTDEENFPIAKQKLIESVAALDLQRFIDLLERVWRDRYDGYAYAFLRPTELWKLIDVMKGCAADVDGWYEE